MPKRRMTAARILQIATWQKAGANSPRRTPAAISSAMFLGRKVIPTGKQTLLYHRTTAASAAAITRDRKWISGARMFSGRRGYSWLSKGGPTQASGYYGTGLVTVKVPRKAVQLVSYNAQDAVEFVQVKNSVLKGLPVKRLM